MLAAHVIVLLFIGVAVEALAIHTGELHFDLPCLTRRALESGSRPLNLGNQVLLCLLVVPATYRRLGVRRKHGLSRVEEGFLGVDLCEGAG